jgi:hypothetical protein
MVNNLITLKLLKFILGSFIFFTSTLVFAQEDAENEEDTFDWLSLIYENDRFTFNAGMYGMKAKTYNIYGPAKLNTRLGYGFYGNVNYLLPINKTFALEAGFKWGAMPFNFQWDIGELLQNPYFFSKSSYSFATYVFPLKLISRVRISPKSFIHLKSGVDFRHLGATTTRTHRHFDGNSGTILSLNYGLVEKSAKIHPNFCVGLDQVLPNYDVLSFNLVFNFSPNSIIEGRYHFFPNNVDFSEFESEGVYQTRGNYIGLEVGYSLTSAGKKLRQMKAIGRKARRERDL